MSEDVPTETGERDLLALSLEVGVAFVVVAAPFPFGAVPPGGRAALEVVALLLGAIWTVQALRGRAGSLPRVAAAGLVGLLALAAFQLLPLGPRAVALLSPRSLALAEAARPAEPVRAAEARLLGADPSLYDRVPSISVDPDATASALRTGAALAALLLAASTVAGSRGLRGLATAMLIGAAVQGLWGTLALAAGGGIGASRGSALFRAATGTFVNKNHFGGYLAATLPCALALALSRARRTAGGGGARRRALDLFGAEGSRNLLVGLLVATGLAGLFLSLSRAAISLGLGALILVGLAVRRHRPGARMLVVVVLAAVAAVPLLQLGGDVLIARFSETARDLSASGGRATVWTDALEMAAAFPLFGTGFGTFAAAYPAFRSPSVRLLYEHAHNDAVQACSEGGIVGVALLLMLLVPVVIRAVRGLTGASGALAAGVGAGALALLLHGTVDFNFHIPSNAALGAILAGALLGLTWSEPTSA